MVAADDNLVRSVREKVLQLAVPAGLLTGTLYYLGWVHTRAVFRELGVRPRQLGLGTTDYVLTSMNVLVLAAERLVILGLVLTAALHGLRVFRRHRGDHAGYRAAAWTVMAVSIVVAVGEPLVRTIDDPVRSSFVAFTASLTAIGALAGLTPGRPDDRAWRRRGLPPTRAEAEARRAMAWFKIVLGLLLVSSLFNLTREWADDQGVQTALRVEGSPEIFPEAAITTTAPLGLEKFGVAFDADTMAATGRYRYSGLRVFTEANGRVFVWPCQQMLRDGVIVVNTADIVRYEQRSWRSRRNERSPLIPGQDAECPTGADLATRHWLADFARLQREPGIEYGALGVTGGRPVGRADVWLKDGERVTLAVVIADTDSFVGRLQSLEEFAAEGVEEVWFVTTRQELLDVYRDLDGEAGEYRDSGRYQSSEPILIDGLVCALDPGDLHRRPRPIADRCDDRR
ncbi:MAG: hypothetical protein OES24_16010 [Acidimicrobiia bacterium]|nr:hypothetical protein [Acidimicrobiia bacterium]